MPWISGNRYLTLDETENNGYLAYNYFISIGWTPEAICAMLGNMQAESGINPGIWENLQPYQGGYGLTQWTPYTKYSAWYGPGWEDNGPGECSRIQYESENEIQWFYNAEIGMAPPITFQQFTESTLPLHDLTNYWLWFYEHPANPGPATQAVRQAYADAWWQRVQGGTATLPPWLLKQITRRW